MEITTQEFYSFTIVFNGIGVNQRLNPYSHFPNPPAAVPVESPLHHWLFTGVTNVLVRDTLYKEPIDRLSVDHVLQEITHKDMCHRGLWIP